MEQLIAQLIGGGIGIAFLSLFIALIIQCATKKVAKFKPPYGKAYISALLGTLAAHISVSFAWGLTMHGFMDITHTHKFKRSDGDILLIGIIAGFVVQGVIYGKLIKDSAGIPLGIRNGFAVAGMQLVVGLGIFAVFLIVPIIAMR